MGLDMYLNKRYFISNILAPDDGKWHITIQQGNKPSTIDPEKIKHIETEEIYWRKANAIHKWFVDNVQDGNDNCGSYYVDEDKLRELLAACNKVLEQSEIKPGKVYNGETWHQGVHTVNYVDGEVITNTAVAEELLPTQRGFFFGNTAYDGNYIDDIRFTKKELERVLAVKDDGDFYYSSSW